MDLRDVHILSPRLLAFTGRLGELSWGINRSRHFEDLICKLLEFNLFFFFCWPLWISERKIIQKSGSAYITQRGRASASAALKSSAAIATNDFLLGIQHPFPSPRELVDTGVWYRDLE